MTRRAGFDLRQIAFGLQFRKSVTMIAIPKQAFSFRQLNVVASRAMASLTAHINFCERRAVLI